MKAENSLDKNSRRFVILICNELNANNQMDLKVVFEFYD